MTPAWLEELKELEAKAREAGQDARALNQFHAADFAYVTALRKALPAIIALAQQAQQDKAEPTDDAVMKNVINECDALDIHRVHERRDGKWVTTTIFDSDEALLRAARAALGKDKP